MFNRKGYTGLYASYKISNSADNLYRFGSTYDQALIVIHAVKSGDLSTAKTILDFFKKQFYSNPSLKVIYVSYNIDTGIPYEYIVKTGEMVWLGIALYHYENLTKDTRYHSFISDLANRIRTFQQSDGRFLGGVGMDWTSTEHNVSARAFYLMVYSITHDPAYLSISNRVKDWLLNTAYNSAQKRFNRGFNDPSFATDTHSWGILGLYDVLTKSQKNGLIQYVETNANVGYGFDFTNRHSAISYEWTLQMCAAYFILGQEDKANNILRQIEAVWNLNGGIPYASQTINTTHGWTAMTHLSMSSLIWYVLAQTGFNPLYSPMMADSSAAGNLPENLTQAKVFPNPLRIHKGKKETVFANLTAYATIRIYSYLGELVRQISADAGGTARWNAENSYGQPIASGVYLAVIEGTSAAQRVLKVIVEK